MGERGLTDASFLWHLAPVFAHVRKDTAQDVPLWDQNATGKNHPSHPGHPAGRQGEVLKVTGDMEETGVPPHPATVVSFAYPDRNDNGRYRPVRSNTWTPSNRITRSCTVEVPVVWDRMKDP